MTVRGKDVMPLPPDVRDAVSRLAEGYRYARGMIQSTQVYSCPAYRVPEWVGEAKDAYMESIRRLGKHTHGFAGVFVSPAAALGQWADAVDVAISKTVPELWDRYDQAERNYQGNLQDLAERVRQETDAGRQVSAEEIADEKRTLLELRDEDQANILAEYKAAMTALDAVAGEVAGKFTAALDSFVEPGKQGSRNQVGSALFNDIPVVDGQAEWEQAQELAPQAARYLKNSSPTPEEIMEFNAKYGGMCSNPFFAQALAQHVTPEDMTKFLIKAEQYKGQLANRDAYDESLKSLSASLGSSMVLSTGGMNADPANAHDQEAFSAAKAGLITDSGESISTLTSARLNQWKAVGNTLYRSDGDAAGAGEKYMGGNYGHHYGYEYLGTLLSSAANSNPNLALGAEFLNEKSSSAGVSGSLAQDIVAFDHKHGAEIAQYGGYGNWGQQLSPGGDRNTTDPVESMLKLMDEPSSLHDGSLDGVPQHQDSISDQNAKRFEAVQKFLTSDTTFDVNAEDVPARENKLEAKGPMNMTRYLTGFRGNEYYSGTQDGGDSLGRVLAQAAAVETEPHGLDIESEEYKEWRERSKRAALVSGNFLRGYQEGLDIKNNLINGEDPFGIQHRSLRNWAGSILAPQVEGLTKSLGNPEGGAPVDVAPLTGENQYLISLNEDWRKRILGPNGLFTDLGFDQPLANGRESAINVLRMAAHASYEKDLSDVFASRNAVGEGSPGSSNALAIKDAVEGVQNKWAPILNDLAHSPAAASEQAGKALDANNARWKSLIEKGIGAIPFGNIIGEGRNVAKWLVEQTKSVGVPMTLDALLDENNAEEARQGGVAAGRDERNRAEDVFYQAVSEGKYWGEDERFSPRKYIENSGKEVVSFLDDNGEVKPYNRMTELEKKSFRNYISAERTTRTDGVMVGGLNPIYGGAPITMDAAMNNAEINRKEFMGEK